MAHPVRLEDMRRMASGIMISRSFLFVMTTRKLPNTKINLYMTIPKLSSLLQRLKKKDK